MALAISSGEHSDDPDYDPLSREEVGWRYRSLSGHLTNVAADGRDQVVGLYKFEKSRPQLN